MPSRRCRSDPNPAGGQGDPCARRWRPGRGLIGLCRAARAASSGASPRDTSPHPLAPLPPAPGSICATLRSVFPSRIGWRGPQRRHLPRSSGLFFHCTASSFAFTVHQCISPDSQLPLPSGERSVSSTFRSLRAFPRGRTDAMVSSSLHLLVCGPRREKKRTLLTALPPTSRPPRRPGGAAGPPRRRAGGRG